jgi:hypothetical protein
MTRPGSVVIHLPTPANPLHSYVAGHCAYQAAAEYRATLLIKLLKRLQQQELATISSALVRELIVPYRQAII